MLKKKISKRQKLCFEDMPIVKLKPGVKSTPFRSLDFLLDKKEIGAALLENLEKDDFKRMREIIKDYSALLKKHGPLKAKAKPAKKSAVSELKRKKIIVKTPIAPEYSSVGSKRAKNK